MNKIQQARQEEAQKAADYFAPMLREKDERIARISKALEEEQERRRNSLVSNIVQSQCEIARALVSVSNNVSHALRLLSGEGIIASKLSPIDQRFPPPHASGAENVASPWQGSALAPDFHLSPISKENPPRSASKKPYVRRKKTTRKTSA